MVKKEFHICTSYNKERKLSIYFCRIYVKQKVEIVMQNEIQKDTLVIIGNGFDIWQGYHTGYAEFQMSILASPEPPVQCLRATLPEKESHFH